LKFLLKRNIGFKLAKESTPIVDFDLPQSILTDFCRSEDQNAQSRRRKSFRE